MRILIDEIERYPSIARLVMRLRPEELGVILHLIVIEDGGERAEKFRRLLGARRRCSARARYREKRLDRLD